MKKKKMTLADARLCMTVFYRVIHKAGKLFISKVCALLLWTCPAVEV